MEIYFFLALILLVINSAVTFIVYLITKKRGKKISLFTIFAITDLILTFITAGIAVCYHISEGSLGTALLLGMYLIFYLPVAAVLFFGAVIIDIIDRVTTHKNKKNGEDE